MARTKRSKVKCSVPFASLKGHSQEAAKVPLRLSQVKGQQLWGQGQLEKGHQGAKVVGKSRQLGEWLRVGAGGRGWAGHRAKVKGRPPTPEILPTAPPYQPGPLEHVGGGWDSVSHADDLGCGPFGHHRRVTQAADGWRIWGTESGLRVGPRWGWG